MKRIIISALMLIFLLSACTSTAYVGNAGFKAELTPQKIEPLPDEFAQGVNAFGFDAAQLLYSEDENLAISPLSIEMAMLMTRAGAAGETADEIRDTLRVGDMSDEEIIAACKSAMWRANTGGMEAANSIWLGSRCTFSEDFTATCTKDFMADAMPLVIPGAKDEVNAWVDEKTHGKIKDIITEEFDPLTEAVLCNTLYYLGDWVQPFESNNTHEGDFHTPNGTVTAPFMHDERYVPYFENDDFSMISLHFKSEEDEGKYAMAFLLPREGKTVADLLASFEDTGFADALLAMEDQNVQIALPKFEFDFAAGLKELLKALGINETFDSTAADFSRMTDEPNELFISKVHHKCYIRVDELGAEAAAATVVEMTAECAPEEPKYFAADRPFVFAIYSLEDSTIAFLGVVNNPTK